MSRLSEFIEFLSKDTTGLIPKKVEVHRDGKTFQATRYVSPDEAVVPEKTKKPKDSPLKKNALRVLRTPYNSLVPRSEWSSPHSAALELVDEINADREQHFSEKEARFSSYIFKEWVKGPIWAILSIRQIAGKLSGREMSKDAMRSFVSATLRQNMTDSDIDKILSQSKSVMAAKSFAHTSSEDVFKQAEEVIQKERHYAVQKTKELFGDDVLVYRCVYGPVARKMWDELEKNGSVDVEDLPATSYTQDGKAAAAFGINGPGSNKGGFFVFSRRVKADDVLSAWYSNPGFVSFISQKEIVLNPKNAGFTIRKEDVQYGSF